MLFYKHPDLSLNSGAWTSLPHGGESEVRRQKSEVRGSLTLPQYFQLFNRHLRMSKCGFQSFAIEIFLLQRNCNEQISA